MFLLKSESKGVLAWESGIRVRLVSPAAGCEKKKKDTSGRGPWILKLSTFYHNIVTTECTGRNTAHENSGENESSMKVTSHTDEISRNE